MGQFGVSSFVWLTKSHGEPRHVVGSQQKTTTKAAFLHPLQAREIVSTSC